MAGHSKWHSIRHKKAITDAKRGKVLNKHSKILMVVGRNDPNPETNASLRAAIANAKADSVPGSNIDKILKKLRGEGKDGAVYSPMVYEGFGPDGVPFIVTALTDNPNRTFPELRLTFSKNGGNLGTSGSVGFLFDHVGVITVDTGTHTEESLFELIADAGASDLIFDTDTAQVITEFTQLGTVRDALATTDLTIKKAEPAYHAKDSRPITDAKVLAQLEKFTAAVEESVDIDDVYGGWHLAAV